MELVNYVREIAMREGKDVEELLRSIHESSEEKMEEIMSLEMEISGIFSFMNNDKKTMEASKRAQKRKVRQIILEFFSETIVKDVFGDHFPGRTGGKKAISKRFATPQSFEGM